MADADPIPTTAQPGAPPPITTAALITAMVDSGKGISDLVFSPGRPPQVEKSGELVAVNVPQLPLLRAEDTSRSGGGHQPGNPAGLQTL
jgi:hypothetical protein